MNYADPTNINFAVNYFFEQSYWQGTVFWWYNWTGFKFFLWLQNLLAKVNLFRIIKSCHNHISKSVFSHWFHSFLAKNLYLHIPLLPRAWNSTTDIAIPPSRLSSSHERVTRSSSGSWYSCWMACHQLWFIIQKCFERP